MYVLDPIEPSGIVKVASIVMPHSFAGVEVLECRHTNPPSGTGFELTHCVCIAQRPITIC